MDLSELSKVMHAARLVIDGSFSSQHHACVALNIPHHISGRVSDAYTILTRGIPEVIAGVESGRLPLQTAWHIARKLPYDQQLSALQRIQMSASNGRNRHGLYTGRADKVRKKHRTAQDKIQERVCSAVDKLLEAIGERVDALAVCTNGTRPEPDPEQGREWRRTLRRCRKAFTKLEKSIDWTKTEELPKDNPEQGAGNDASTNGTQ